MPISRLLSEGFSYQAGRLTTAMGQAAGPAYYCPPCRSLSILRPHSSRGKVLSRWGNGFCQVGDLGPNSMRMVDADGESDRHGTGLEEATAGAEPSGRRDGIR